jgi:hypothetical protein
MTQPYEEPTGWTGWIAFAGIMMLIGGSIAFLQGLVAAVNDEWVGWNAATSNAIVVDLSAWGWVHMIVGVIVFLAGIGVFTGNILARTVGVIIASVSLIVNFMWLPAYPIWAIIVITIDALVIWALTAHGREMKEI